MKPIVKTCLIALIPLFSSAQQSERYLELMGKYELIDSVEIKTSYKNGNPKYVGTTTYYQYNGKEYQYLTGKHIRYYKNGSRTEGLYDRWGAILQNKYFDKEGNLISDSKASVWDTSAKDLKEFEESNKHIIFILESKGYKYSSGLSKWYVYRETEYTNGKKSGIWKYYLPNGELKKKVEK